MAKVLSWILSFSLHAALVLVPLRLAVAPKTAGRGVSRVEIALVAETASRDVFPRDEAMRGVSRRRVSGEARLDERLTDVAPLRKPTGQSVHPLPQMRVHALRLHSQAQPVPPLRTMGLESFDLFPRPQDVLADAPLAFAGQKERGTTSLGETTRGMPLGESAAEDRNPVHTDLVTNEKPPPSVERIGWEGQARTLIRKQDPSFPPTLGAEGQEVECEARIVVAPNGTVIHVEITKSSGYTEIDTSVESALRAYLFSRGDARKEAVGTIRFRFRLEKRD